MLKKTALFLTFTAMLAPAALFASTECKTKYPVVFSHGIAGNNQMFGFDGSYFYGVKKAVNDRGCNSYYTNVDCMNTKEAKAIQFKAQILQILAVSGAEKVNIIGHSDGSLYSRLAITNMGLSKYIASHTSICGPHRGSKMADIASGIIESPSAKFGVAVLAGSLDFFYKYIVGDSGVDNAAQAKCLALSYMAAFNKNVPNVDGIYYQSWATRLKTLPADAINMGAFVMAPTWIIETALEGDNDGVVPVASAKWGNFRGTNSGAWWCFGVSHLNATGQFFGVTPGFSAPIFFTDIVKDLKARGF